MSIVQELPRTAVHTYLKLTRLPLTAVERVFKPSSEDATSWPPAIVFEDFEARVKDLAATLLGDDVLRQDATLQRARVSQLRRAVELEGRAEATRAQAEQELAGRRAEVEADRQEAQERAETNKARLERERREAEARAAERAAQDERRAADLAAAERERVERLERDAEAKRLEAEREALAEKQTALTSRDEAVRLEKAADAAKQRRKAKPA